ncbi:hypothetical protein LOTGIDRAFT_227994 [Lottia gigantea]|uniref:DEP domain-containing protein n=1 Tax=Lottia gigantea TaxID=225164 RepID=V4BHN9_LOTGI|nr:hypothetical protein LOTGIDRAFT_227994 [Lottia gigantea]ESP05372.1 hypothetical protein LOTGIDRAFT_227994 [Lottia gigantea]
MELKGRIIVYSIMGCPHCMRAKNSLQEHNLPYTDISLDLYPQCREEFQAKTGKKTVPQIFFNNKHIGGNDDLQAVIKNKEELKKLIEEVKNNESQSDAPVPPDPSTAQHSADPGEIVCEPDEYAILVHDLKDSGLIKDHRKGLKTYKNSFSGKDFVDWVVKTKQLEREQAIEMGQALIDNHFGHNVKSSETFEDKDVYYRLLDDDDEDALNSGGMSDCKPRPAAELGADLRKLILRLYAAFLSPDGKKVDYKGIGGSDEFKHYIKLTKELQRVEIVDASREEKLAFFINVYNALVVHANVSRGPPFFNTVKYIIGGHSYSLQDIENGVLRANRKGVGMFSNPFGKNDPRLKVALEKHEPLIHFGLVCGAKSCPPIKTYTPDMSTVTSLTPQSIINIGQYAVIEQLKVASEAFLDGPDGCDVNVSKKTVYLSSIFKWYFIDFGKNNEELVQWVYDYMGESEKKEKLKEVMSGKFKVSYLSYDWSVNSK